MQESKITLGPDLQVTTSFILSSNDVNFLLQAFTLKVNQWILHYNFLEDRQCISDVHVVP